MRLLCDNYIFFLQIGTEMINL